MNYRKTIRKGIKNIKRSGLFLYGRLRSLEKAVAYCKLHKCYLEPKDIKEKGCNKKKCKYNYINFIFTYNFFYVGCSNLIQFVYLGTYTV